MNFDTPSTPTPEHDDSIDIDVSEFDTGKTLDQLKKEGKTDPAMDDVQVDMSGEVGMPQITAEGLEVSKEVSQSEISNQISSLTDKMLSEGALGRRLEKFPNLKTKMASAMMSAYLEAKRAEPNLKLSTPETPQEIQAKLVDAGWRAFDEIVNGPPQDLRNAA